MSYAQIKSIRDPESLREDPRLMVVREAVIYSYDNMETFLSKRGPRRKGLIPENILADFTGQNQIRRPEIDLEFLKSQLATRLGLIEKLTYLKNYIEFAREKFKGKDWITQDQQSSIIYFWQLTSFLCGLSVYGVMNYVKKHNPNEFDYYAVYASDTNHFGMSGHVVGILKSKSTPEKWYFVSPANIFNVNFSSPKANGVEINRATEVIVANTFEDGMDLLMEQEGGYWEFKPKKQGLVEYDFDEESDNLGSYNFLNNAKVDLD